MAKPTLFTEELFEEILDRHAAGETIREICRSEGMPKHRTFYDWLTNPDLERRFKSARRAACDTIADQVLEISDTPEVGIVEKLERVAKPRATGADKDAPLEFEEVCVERRREDMLGHRKLKVESRLKLLAKWDTRYSDKVSLEHSGGMGLALTINEAPKPA